MASLEVLPFAFISIFSLALLFVFSSVLSCRKTGAENESKPPPGPPKLPIIGNMHQLGSLPHRSFAELAKKHGPLMLLRIGRVPTLVVSSKELAQEIMKTHDLDFANRHASVPVKKMFYRCKDMAFAPYGEHWRKMNKICVMEILSKGRVQSFGSVRDEEVSESMRKIMDSRGSVVNLREIFVSLTKDVVCRASLGKKYFGTECHGSSFSELLKELLVLLGGLNFRDFLPILGWVDMVMGIDWRQRKNSRAWNGFLDQVLKDHLDPNREQNEHKDFVDVLLDVQKHSKLGIPFTMDTIKGLIMDIISAGTETTSTTMEWAMSELIRHPQIMKKAQVLVREAIGRKSKVEEGDLHKLSYLKSIIMETLRLHPSLPLLLPRESINNTKLHGYTIPAKSLVYINAWAIGRDPMLWERGEEFLPDRFMDSKMDFKGQDFTMIPFGAGRRACPGISFAGPVMELALANMLNQFNWELPDGAKSQDLDMSEEFVFTLQRKSPLLVVATPHFI